MTGKQARDTSLKGIIERLCVKNLICTENLMHFLTCHGPYREKLHCINLMETNLCLIDEREQLEAKEI